MKKLTQSRILGYAVGDLGVNLNFQMMGFYLAYFYTDVFGISPAHVAGLLLAARIWDAFNDPAMGYIADHTKSKWGRFRPYLLFSAIPLNVILVLCFVTPDLNPTLKVIYAYVTYIAHGMIFTTIQIPYSSLTAVMTQDPQERAVISSYRMFMAVVLGLSVVAVGVKPFVSLFPNEQQGFFAAAVVLGVFSTILLWVSFFASRERIQARSESYKFKDMFPILFKNRELLVLAIAMLTNTSVWVVGNTVALYYFKYIIQDTSLQPVFFLVMIPCNIIGTILTPALTKRFGKKRVFMVGSLLLAAFSVSRYFVADPHILLFFGLSMICTVSQMMCSITQWGMLPDTVEYGEWKSGHRSEGIPYAFFSFMQKAGMALAASFAAMLMSWTGYEANTELVPMAEKGIRWLFNVFPAIFSVLCFVSLLFYRLDGDFHKRVMADLSHKLDSI